MIYAAKLTTKFAPGFFTAHAIASGWIVGVARYSEAQASSLYLLACYNGSSITGVADGLPDRERARG